MEDDARGARRVTVSRIDVYLHPFWAHPFALNPHSAQTRPSGKHPCFRYLQGYLYFLNLQATTIEMSGVETCSPLCITTNDPSNGPQKLLTNPLNLAESIVVAVPTHVHSEMQWQTECYGRSSRV